MADAETKQTEKMRFLSTFDQKKHVPILVGLSLLLLMAFSYFRKYKLSLCNRIFIATPTYISGGTKTGYTLHYTYQIKNKTLGGRDGLDKPVYLRRGDEYYLGRRYFVKVDCACSGNSELIWDIDVPASLINIPADGWEKVPQ